MALSMYQASVPVFVRMLTSLKAILDKAEAHAKDTGHDVADYVSARLAPDMASLTGQIQMATDAAKLGAARLAGVTAPSFPDVETTYAELKERVAKTIAYVESLKPEDVSDDEARTIEMQFPGRTMQFTARDFLLNFSLPNFLFHVTTAYGLLRGKGVPIGKMDYLAGGQSRGA